VTRTGILFLTALFASVSAGAQAKRLVLVKVDGLPGDLIEQQIGRNALPWIRYIFLDRGTWVRNFYTRGISLSAPSWSLLDSGQPLTIRGNAEFDRFTGQVYDYLNFFPFYAGYARFKSVDMPGVEVLDQAGVPLLLDQFPPLSRYVSMQLYQRSVRWTTLRESLSNRVMRPARDLINEWETGFEMAPGIEEEQEKEIIAALANPKMLYLDFYLGDYDHVAHLTKDPASQLAVIQHLDARLGRIWNAIQASPLANETVLALVSDHGMNSTPGTYSQGYNLVKLFNSSDGGGHHLVTVRHPMTEFKLKGLDPFVSYVVTPSPDASYLRGQNDYPTALLDPDGNERASVQLRNSDLNAIHILLLQLKRTDVSAIQRSAIGKAVFGIIEANRAVWTQCATQMDDELKALLRAIERQQDLVANDPKKWDKQDRAAELDDVAHRHQVTLETWIDDERGYRAYVRSIRGLLDLKDADLAPGRIRIETLIPKRVMGEPNSLYQLQNYVAGLSPGGIVFTSTGALDLERTFKRVNYFALLANVRVRNLVQHGVGVAPIDFIASRVPAKALDLEPGDRPDSDPIFVYGDDAHQAVLLSQVRDGTLRLRYFPVHGFAQDSLGAIHFTPSEWTGGFPLRLFEDSNLNVAGDQAARCEWLGKWHTEREWFEAIHGTRYSNGVIGLYQYFERWQPGSIPAVFRVADQSDWPVLQRLAGRRRGLTEADFEIFAADHWNFNVRGFNPGGNHGSFLRISTHSVLMAAGGGVPAGLEVDRPYDSLSFVPTLLYLLGRSASGSYPGPVIEEMTRPKVVH
jgi:Type I phosphodiesterase / nucleotide pyrophosphatase